MLKLPEKQIIKNIQKGCSINSQAIEQGVSWNVIKKICDRQQVYSQHTCLKASEENIKKMLKEIKVATAKEIATYFGLNNRQSLRMRLQSMVRRQQIKRTKLSTFKSPKKHEYQLFKGYMETFLFYKTDSDFKEWVIKQIPIGLPQNVRKTITQYLTDQGLKIDLTRVTPMRSIAFTEAEYKKIKKKAKKEQKGIKELILDATK